MPVSLIVALSIASQSATTAPPAGSVSLSPQQAFDAASILAEDGKCKEAVAAFDAVEQGTAARKSEIVRAAIAVRKGICLSRLGEIEAGENAIKSGVPVLATKGENFRGDVLNAYMALGNIAITRQDYVSAREPFKAALANSVGTGRVMPLVALARVTAFDGGPQPLKYVNEALTIARSTPGMSKDNLAALQTVHARILMNQGRDEEAYKELKDSLKLQGGLSMKVSLSEVATRGDLALAALNVGKKDEAKNYLAYTGAGRMKGTPFAKADSMDPPYCGGTADIKPDDTVVVEFTLNDDGSVSQVTPIFTTKGREVALAFARAVAQWSWKPSDAKAVSAFYRYATRVEMRCTQAGARPSVINALVNAFADWAGSEAFAFGRESDARTLLQAVAMTAPGGAAEGKALLAALLWLGRSGLVADDERMTYLQRAEKLASVLNAPVSTNTLIAVSRVIGDSDVNGHRFRTGLRAILAKPEVANDPVSAAALRLMLVGQRGWAVPVSDQEALIDAVAADNRLPSDNALKINALLQKASFEAKKGNFKAAQAAFSRTGLSEQQCAVIGLAPALKQTGNLSSAFPEDALRMGFEGWVKLEFDVTADGRTSSPRVTIAYPPLIFSPAATSMSRNLRYASSFRPQGGSACNANQENINFVNGRN